MHEKILLTDNNALIIGSQNLTTTSLLDLENRELSLALDIATAPDLIAAANMYHFVEPWRSSFQEIAEFLTGHQADVADDRVLATVLFTDIVDSTHRAAEIGDRDWHALHDAHDAVVRAQLSRFRGREVNTSGDGFLAMFDGPQRAIRCAMAIRDAVRSLGIEVRAGLHTGECEVRGDDIGGIGVHIYARERTGRSERCACVQHAARPRDRVRARVRGARRARAQGRARRMAPVRRRLCANDIGRAARDADAGTKRFQQRWLSIQPQIVLGS
jgi:class 3 adenylate cyclase